MNSGHKSAHYHEPALAAALADLHGFALIITCECYSLQFDSALLHLDALRVAVTTAQNVILYEVNHPHDSMS